MAKGKVADTKPKVGELEPGEYMWCRCGQSKNKSFCDGSHQGTEFTPLKFVVEEKKVKAICLCKQTDDEPFCDGSHTSLPKP
ncbi:MAG: CDGSH iron-sulfur domain-containing protein [Candidatus Krumholzibacteria bacterium]|nr:CDGSH iron-sulfur domain-containing protein [Candidatus Krumholzibacteria bacterium]